MPEKTDLNLPPRSALLLQGGALRGCYTSGVLDVLMEEGIYFPTVAGVSAGALNAMNYVARQPGRSARINLNYRHDPRYLGPLAVMKGGGVFGLEFLMETLSEKEPFDQTTFDESPQNLFVVATSLATGRAEFFEKGVCEDFTHAIIASASMPLASLPVKVGAGRYLDGGCACPIPLRWALERGQDKIVVVTTQAKGYRKPRTGQRMVDLYGDFYARHTQFYATLLTMDLRYNALMDELDELEADGRIFVVRPSEPISIGRFEGDTNKLLALVNLGRRDMLEQVGAMKEYLFY